MNATSRGIQNAKARTSSQDDNTLITALCIIEQYTLASTDNEHHARRLLVEELEYRYPDAADAAEDRHGEPNKTRPEADYVATLLGLIKAQRAGN